jgi:hypothetical protein
MNHTRTAIMSLIVIGAVIFVFVWNRREREGEAALAAASGSATAAGSASTAGSGTGSAQPAPPGVRKIDRKGREVLLERMKSARAARTGGSTGTSGASGTPPPALPALPGMLSKDEIRKGVRAVIPLLAECYDAAQDRLAIKTGRIEVKMHLTGEPDIGTLIESAEIGGDKHFTGDADLVECLQQTMLSVELPPIAEGGTIDVTYPIEFAPG